MINYKTIKATLALCLCFAVILPGCSLFNKTIPDVSREEFLGSLEAAVGTEIYGCTSVTEFNIRDSLSDDWYVYMDGEMTDDYLYLPEGASDISDFTAYIYLAQNNPHGNLLYCEVSETTDLDAIMDRYMDYYHLPIMIDQEYISDENYSVGRTGFWGSPVDNCYLIYSSVHYYSTGEDAKWMIYRNGNQLINFLADSEELFNSFATGVGLPELYEFNSIVDFGSGNVYLEDDELHFAYYEFDDNNDAMQFFEDRYYDSFVDVYEDNDFDGYCEYELNGERGDYAGYITLNGEFDEPQYDYTYDYLNEVYGGFYIKGNVVVAVFSRSDSLRRTDVIDQFLGQLGLSLPSEGE